jgi:hypothetical protein
LTVSLNIEAHQAGTVPGAGSFACLDCGSGLVLTSMDELPECPNCDGSRFRRASLFEHAAPQDHPTAEIAIVAEPEFGEWVAELRDEIDDPGQFLAYHDSTGLHLVTLAEGWTRIGRSAAADIRLDDPTVSRRHALLVHEDDAVRVLDDRSLNGICVNDQPIDWRTLEDGDELSVGRFRLHFISI